MLSGKSRVEQQVEEELQFHCEMLKEKYQRTGLSEEAAAEATRRRFGDVERVQAECVAISKRSRPAVKLLKLVLLLFFVSGLSLRINSVGINFKQLADLLMATGVLGQLLLYVKGLHAGRSQAVRAEQPLSILWPGARPSIEAFDAEGRTPFERLVAEKSPKGS
jgi:hypothetical protein